jgi:biopolymer transport protein ExbB
MGFYSMVAFFQKGGLFMYPILIVFSVGMAIAIERWVQLNRIGSANQKMWKQLHPVLVKGEFDTARKMVNKDKSSMAKMLEMGLARQGAVRRRDDIEIAMEESMMEIIPQLEKRTPYVALLSNIATLMSAIPLLLLHAKLTSTAGEIVDSLEMASVKALNSISNFAKRQFERK